MDELNSHRDRLEANLLTLNKFEGLESDLIQQHGNLRAQFTAYREAIESTSFGINEQSKKEHLAHHDELIKKLHQLILVAKGLARKRTEQMSRDELFKISQERQKSMKPQSPEDKVGEEVTKSLKRMLETMKIEVERSAANMSTARSTTKNLNETSENYKKLSSTLDESRSLIRDLWKKNRNDMIYIFGALGIFLATAIWVIMQRIPGIFLIPGKFVINQLKSLNLIKKTQLPIGKIFNDVNEVSQSISTTEEISEMFIDTIPKRKEFEIYENDPESKLEKEFVEGITSNTIDQILDPNVEHLIVEELISTSPESENEILDPIGNAKPVEIIEFVTNNTELIDLVEPSVNTESIQIKEFTESIENSDSMLMAKREILENTTEKIETDIRSDSPAAFASSNIAVIDLQSDQNSQLNIVRPDDQQDTNFETFHSTKTQSEVLSTSTVQILPVETHSQQVTKTKSSEDPIIAQVTTTIIEDIISIPSSTVNQSIQPTAFVETNPVDSPETSKNFEIIAENLNLNESINESESVTVSEFVAQSAEEVINESTIILKLEALQQNVDTSKATDSDRNEIDSLALEGNILNSETSSSKQIKKPKVFNLTGASKIENNAETTTATDSQTENSNYFSSASAEENSEQIKEKENFSERESEQSENEEEFDKKFKVDL